jgi:hypothetical protein
VNMAAPKSIIEQVLEAISVIPFARTVAEIEVARAHLSISYTAICASNIRIHTTYGWRLITAIRRDTLTMVIAIVWRSP